MQLDPGTRIGSYEVLQPLGGGGMGQVWKARDLRLGRDLAIKFIRDDLAMNELQVRRFEREARSASALSHPSIVTVYEIGEYESHPYIAMELIEGRRLRDLMAGGPIPAERATTIAGAIAEGLAAAHGRGITHRDLKPENIMITPEGRVKILDFGLARIEEPFREGESHEATLPGMIVGTAAYLSPEQARGGAADFRSDQFAFGAILYEMLAGHSPFRRGSSMETIAAILHDDPPPLAEAAQGVPLPLERIVERCLRKEARERYGSTADLAHDLAEVHDSGWRTPTFIDRSASRLRPRFTRRAGLIAAGVVAVALVAGGTFVASRNGSGAAPRPPGTPAPATALPSNPVLLVLPMDDPQGDSEGRAKLEGMLEHLSARLGTIPGMQVIRPSAQHVKGLTGDDLGRASREFGANLVLRLSATRQADQIRTSYGLLDPATGIQITGGGVDGRSSLIFDLGDRLLASIVGSLAVTGAPQRSDASLLSPSSQDRFIEAIGYLRNYDDAASVQRAVAILEPIVAANPQSALLHASLGRALLAEYELSSNAASADRAIAESQRAAALDPDLAQARLSLGQAHALRGDFEAAVREYRLALAQKSGDPDTTLELAKALDRLGRDAEAEEAFRAAIKARPSYWSGHNGLAVFLFRRGRIDEAIHHASEALRVSPDHPRALANLGGFQIAGGDFEGASKTLARAIAIDPTGHAYANFGFAHYYLGHFSEARRAYEEAVLLEPNYRNWLNLADVRRWTGDDTAAVQAYGRAIELGREAATVSPNNPTIPSRLALAYQWTGNTSAADEAMARALRLTPDDPDVLNRAAILATARRKHEEAIHYLERAVAAGYSRTLIAREPEFRGLRPLPQFQKIIAAQPAPS